MSAASATTSAARPALSRRVPNTMRAILGAGTVMHEPGDLLVHE